MPRKHITLRIVVAVAAVLAAPFAFTQQAAPAAAVAPSVVPRLINFSGVLKNGSGQALKEMTGVTFSLYKDQAGGAALWMETQNVQADGTGHYTVLLGATKPDGLPIELFSTGEARWLGVQPEGQSEQPRVLLLSVPYALKAGDAETIGGLPPTAFELAPPAGKQAGAKGAGSHLGAHANVPAAAVSGGGTLNFVPLWTPNGNTLGNSVLFQSGASIGIQEGGSYNIGDHAIAFGFQLFGDAFLGFAGNPKSSGLANTGIGVIALESNTTGNDNTATGFAALRSNTTGGDNTATGYSALGSNSIGSNNTAIGFSALKSNTTGGTTRPPAMRRSTSTLQEATTQLLAQERSTPTP